jgi:acyl-CoA synthetase (AMP-forming)/AMP-acid ligase II
MTVRPEPPALSYPATLGACSRRAAELFGDRDFIVLPEERVTFAEIEERSRVLAKRMLASGIGKGTRVGLWFTYSTEWVVAWLAASRIGAVAMPFSTLFTGPELRTVLELGDVAVLICPPRFLKKDVPAILAEALPGLTSASEPELALAELPYLRSIWITGPTDTPWARTVDLSGTDDTGIDDALLERAEGSVVPSDLAVVVYTSGSSALPKGVMHTHGAIVRTTAVFGTTVAESGNPVLFCAFPFFWIGGILILGGALQSGLTACCIERFEPGAALDLIERERCGLIAAWPSLIQSLRDHPGFADRDLDPKSALVAGPADTFLIDAPVPGIPGHRGMSETVGNWNGVERKVVDPTTGEMLPDYEEGELLIRGFGVTQGYYKLEREDVFDADGWLHTGDRCFMVENRPFFVGRFYEMIKSRGANVSPREVELALEGLDEVTHAFVFGLPHPDHGEEVVAVVVPSHGETLDLLGLEQRLRAEVSSYKVPTRWLVVASEDEIPWLASGKPDKRALRERIEGVV